MLSLKTLLTLTATAAAIAHTTQTICNKASFNTTTTTYTTNSNHTIFSIARKFHSGACDIARTNRIIDVEHLYAGFTLQIPREVCIPDHSNSCLLIKQNATATCLKGGPHDYRTIAGDTVERMALYKLNVTLDTVWAQVQKMDGGVDSPTQILPGGT
ncbi:hypothetical protein NUU61_001898 [Penicillium alfredii]|uniref:LysM domain-containing protein n=1 Tax=Penicillium alfredii TaxID=1506179 RepID=A0A9W9KG52_9EURO|nr:uncharacterized protein NUU61_001898 [Penicillium alfredii]KAJ5104551.1 hypothetical protein NUU61_001898 [Penicillium alfredii]